MGWSATPTRRDLCYSGSMTTLKDTDAAYLAGLIDGEGTISIYRCKSTRYVNGFNYRPVVEISNTYKGILEWAHGLIGDGWLKITNPGNVLKKGHKPLWRFRVSTTDCRWVLPQIRPYLRIKGEQADVLIAYFERVTNTRPAHRDETETLARQLNVLNRRGADVT